MIEEETVGRLNFGALRDAIERRDPDLMLGFYAEDAGLRVVNGGSAEGPGFELRGNAEIERCLRVVFGQRTSGRIREEVVDEDLIVFAEVCEYPDGTRVVVRTTLELSSEGRISLQVDVVVREAREEDGEGGARGKPGR